MVGKESINRYTSLIERVFCSRYKEGDWRVDFERKDIETAARELEIELPKNLGDVLYSFRYRVSLPEAIRRCAPKGLDWVILPVGRSRYSFIATPVVVITPNTAMAETKQHRE